MKRRVMVIEDDEDIRTALVELLVDCGYEASGAENGRAALDALASADDLPCVILLDLMMPVMDGRTFREMQLRDARIAKIPVIVISAYRDAAKDVKAMTAAAYFTKPMHPDDLVGAVDRVCACAA